ncbi:MAG: TIR domain-containing protein [Actinomycetaceae bacterium]|nr:TIR domain-containing protein [Actinomycetaceae bacterium]
MANGTPPIGVNHYDPHVGYADVNPGVMLTSNDDPRQSRYKYNAFISYRHVEPDFAIAQELHTLIETYKAPKNLAVRQHDNFRVFRDREELPTGELGALINQALADSEYLIVVCSPRTPYSPWCRREIAEFRKTHEDSQIIALLVEGTPEISFPPELRNLSTTVVTATGEDTEVAIELLAADVRTQFARQPNFPGYAHIQATNPKVLAEETKQTRQNLKKTEIHRIMAAILGVSLGDLTQRQRERKMRRAMTAAVAFGTVITAVAIAMTSLFFAAQRAEREANDNAAQLLLDAAATSMDQGNRTYALAQGQVAMETINSSMDGYEASRSAYHGLLLEGLEYGPFTGVAQIDTGALTPYISLAANSEYVVTGGRGNTAVVWELQSGQLMYEFEASSPVIRAHFRGDNELVIVSTRAIEIVSLDSGLSTTKYDVNVDRIETSRMFGNENYLAVLPSDYSLLVYDLRTGEQVYEDAQRYVGLYADYKRDEPLVATTNDDYTTSVVDVSTGKEVALLDAPPKDPEFSYGYNVSPFFSGDGSTLILVDNVAVTWIDTKTWEVTEYLPDLYTTINDSVFKLSYDGNIILQYTLYSTAPMRIDRPGTGMNKEPKDGEYQGYTYLSLSDVAQKIVALAMSPDSKWAVVAYEDGTLHAWDLQDPNAYGNSSHVPESHDMPVIDARPQSMYFTPDSQYVAVSAADGSVTVIAVTGTRESNFIDGAVGQSSANGQWFVTATEYEYWVHEVGSDGSLSTTQLQGTYFPVDGGAETALYGNAISDDGKLMAMVSYTGKYLALAQIQGGRQHGLELGEIIELPPTVVDLAFDRSLQPVFDSENNLYLPGMDGIVRRINPDGQWDREYQIGDSLMNSMAIDTASQIIAVSFITGEYVMFNYATGDIVYEGLGQIIDLQNDNGTLRALGIYSGAFFTVENGQLKKGSEIQVSLKRDFYGRTLATASYDQKYVIAEGSNGNPVLLDVATGTRILEIDNRGVLSNSMQFLGNTYAYAYTTFSTTKLNTDPDSRLGWIESLDNLQQRVTGVVSEYDLEAVREGFF